MPQCTFKERAWTADQTVTGNNVNVRNGHSFKVMTDTRSKVFVTQCLKRRQFKPM